MPSRYLACSILVVLLATWVAACGNKSTPAPTAPTVVTANPSGGLPPPVSNTPEPLPSAPPQPPLGTGTAVITAIGDVGWCGSVGMGRISQLLQTVAGTLILAGDLAYMRGRMEDYRNCFDPDFGRFRARFRPVPGNHEYEDV